MPLPAWAASAPVLCDASCTISTTSAWPHAPASHHAGKAAAPAADSSADLACDDAEAPDGLSPKASTSMSPAYSMSAWDQVDPWLAGCARVCSSSDKKAASEAVAAGRTATIGKQAAPAVHVSQTISTTAAAALDTPPTSSAASAEPDALSSTLLHAADTNTQWEAHKRHPDCMQQQHGLPPELLALSQSQHDSPAVQRNKKDGSFSVQHSDTCACHGAAECTEAPSARHVRVCGSVDGLSAASSFEGMSQLSQGHAPVSSARTFKALRLQLPSTGDDAFLASSSAQQPANTSAESLGSRTAMAPEPATPGSDKPRSVMAQGSLIADASTRTDQNRLQGYSNARVHTSAAPATAIFASACASEGKHSDTAVSLSVSQTAATSATHSLPGAVQQHFSGPFSLSLTSVQTQVASPLLKEMDAALHYGTFTEVPVLPEVACTDAMRSYSDATVSAQSCTQKPVKGQDVPVDRTIPSIWDLDM